jgi:hypothetical protein
MTYIKEGQGHFKVWYVHLHGEVARHNDPRYIRAVRVRSGEICSSPGLLFPREDGGWTRVEVEGDEMNEAEVNGVPLGGTARRLTVGPRAKKGAAGEKVTK